MRGEKFCSQIFGISANSVRGFEKKYSVREFSEICKFCSWVFGNPRNSGHVVNPEPHPVSFPQKSTDGSWGRASSWPGRSSHNPPSTNSGPRSSGLVQRRVWRSSGRVCVDACPAWDSNPFPFLLQTQSDEEIDRFVREKCDSAYHPSCTCKMGSESDPFAVVDPSTKVLSIFTIYRATYKYAAWGSTLITRWCQNSSN